MNNKGCQRGPQRTLGKAYFIKDVCMSNYKTISANNDRLWFCHVKRYDLCQRIQKALGQYQTQVNILTNSWQVPHTDNKVYLFQVEHE